ncbi:MAG: hypothetical protein WC975_13595 [Phycisphaerae bacterium]
MTKQMPTPNVISPQTTESGCLIRLCWMLFGNIAILVSARLIAFHKGSFLSTADFVFWGIILAMIALRYVDITKMGGLTASGQVASITHWKRYTLILGLVALLVWGIAHIWAAYK